jgi:acyl dehydratase
MPWASGWALTPMNEAELRFVYEKNLCVLPTYPVVLGYPGLWIKDPGTGVDWTKLVHGEQGLRIHRLPEAAGEVIGRTRVTGVIDKGEGRGALVLTERKITDAASGELLCTLTSTTFCRADGGFGGPASSAPVIHVLPERTPDVTLDRPTDLRAALIYRLSGDYNPLHAEPAMAKTAGFERPILHGLCTFGIAGHALTNTVCDNDPMRLIAMNVRFTSPVYPGETIRTEMWVDGNIVSFRARVVERDVVVLNNGRAEIT